MNKMNKKGFTLIEMLVVIAIIAVLVSIIIPVVSSSTNKAQAATNAANLRSLKATMVTKMLSEGKTAAEVCAEVNTLAGTAKFYKCNTPGGLTATPTGTDSLDIEVKWGGKTIAQWAADAGQVAS